jgi:hypothetical protein
MNRRGFLGWLGLAPIAVAMPAKAVSPAPVVEIKSALNAGLMTMNQAREELGGFTVPDEFVSGLREILAGAEPVKSTFSVPMERAFLNAVMRDRDEHPAVARSDREVV